MSLIVDINPVPWEILEQVKARILRNRAKKQKREPDKGKELQRVMQVDNGILAKQRWEEPSFIPSGGIHYSISICDEDNNIDQAISDNDWLQWSKETRFKVIDADNNEQTIDISGIRDKRFILMIPKNPNFSYSIKFYPTQWPKLAEDESDDLVGFSFYVARYDYPNDTKSPSDYFALIQKATGLQWSEVESVAIAIDNSGSMETASIQPDLEVFQNKLTQLDIPFYKYVMSERWIGRHIGELLNSTV